MQDWIPEDAEAFFARKRTDDELTRLHNEALPVEIHAATLPRIIPRAGAPRVSTDPSVTLPEPNIVERVTAEDTAAAHAWFNSWKADGAGRRAEQLAQERSVHPLVAAPIDPVSDAELAALRFDLQQVRSVADGRRAATRWDQIRFVGGLTPERALAIAAAALERSSR